MFVLVPAHPIDEDAAADDTAAFAPVWGKLLVGMLAVSRARVRLTVNAVCGRLGGFFVGETIVVHARLLVGELGMDQHFIRGDKFHELNLHA